MAGKKGVSGRPEIAKLDVKKIEEMAGKGLSQEQIAASLGISPGTLASQKKKFEDVEKAILIGRAKGIHQIANSLFLSAIEGNTTAQIFFLKTRAGWKETQVTEIKFIDPAEIAKMSDEQLEQLAAGATISRD